MNTALKSCLQKIRNCMFAPNTKIVASFLLLASTCFLIYRDTFNVPFLFDDITSIVLNPNVQSLQWPWDFLFNNRRPVLYASLALNVHQSGNDPFGFHVFNLFTHIFAALSLFALIYKTCRLQTMGKTTRQNATLLAFSASLLWACHPLQTQAVTYIIQRAESLMALFFILSVYFSSLYLTSKKPLWLILAGITALLSGLTKEVALALPIVILLYDRTFISRSFKKALIENRRLYQTLSFLWVIMLYLYFTTHPEKIQTAGFGLKAVPVLDYAINQPQVILHYLRLVFWPDPLVFDYQWPLSKDLSLLFPSIVLVLSWGTVLIFAYQQYPVLSFLGLSFFVILSPSSSFIPIKDLIYEYRMYLPLSCLSVLFVSCLKTAFDHLLGLKKGKIFLIAVTGILAFVLSSISYTRNQVYLSEEKLWRDILSKQPKNVRVWNNLGSYLLAKGNEKQAIECFLKSYLLNPQSAEISSNLAIALMTQHRFKEAHFYAQKAIELEPDFAIGHHNLGILCSQMGRYQQAIAHYQKALELGLFKPSVLKNLGIALANTGKKQAAINVLKEAHRLDPSAKDIDQALKNVINHGFFQKNPL